MEILINRLSNDEIQKTFFTDRVMAELRACGNVREGTFTRDQLRDALPGVDVLFGSWGLPRLDEDMLSGADRLKMVCYTGGSVAEQMTETVAEKGIHMLSGNRLYANSVAEGTIGYILLAQRRLVKLINETAESGWAPFYPSDGIRFKTIGIIGFGMIAKYLAKMLQAFECRVLICSDWFRPEDEAEYRAGKCDMDTLFAESDIVTLHESLRDDTYHMIDKRYFGIMKQDALFVNTARGPIIVEEDLAEAARAGRIRAILDVFEKEPLPMDSCLRGCENIILVPHKGGPTLDIREHVTLALIRDLRTYMKDGEKAVLENEIPWEYARHMTRAAANIRK